MSSQLTKDVNFLFFLLRYSTVIAKNNIKSSFKNVKKFTIRLSKVCLYKKKSIFEKSPTDIAEFQAKIDNLLKVSQDNPRLKLHINEIKNTASKLSTDQLRFSKYTIREAPIKVNKSSSFQFLEKRAQDQKVKNLNVYGYARKTDSIILINKKSLVSPALYCKKIAPTLKINRSQAVRSYTRRYVRCRKLPKNICKLALICSPFLLPNIPLMISTGSILAFFSLVKLCKRHSYQAYRSKKSTFIETAVVSFMLSLNSKLRKKKTNNHSYILKPSNITRTETSMLNELYRNNYDTAINHNFPQVDEVRIIQCNNDTRALSFSSCFYNIKINNWFYHNQKFITFDIMLFDEPTSNYKSLWRNSKPENSSNAFYQAQNYHNIPNLPLNSILHYPAIITEDNENLILKIQNRIVSSKKVKFNHTILVLEEKKNETSSAKEIFKENYLASIGKCSINEQSVIYGIILVNLCFLLSISLVNTALITLFSTYITKKLEVYFNNQKIKQYVTKLEPLHFQSLFDINSCTIFFNMETQSTLEKRLLLGFYTQRLIPTINFHPHHYIPANDQSNNSYKVFVDAYAAYEFVSIHDINRLPQEEIQKLETLAEKWKNYSLILPNVNKSIDYCLNVFKIITNKSDLVDYHSATILEYELNYFDKYSNILKQLEFYDYPYKDRINSLSTLPRFIFNLASFYKYLELCQKYEIYEELQVLEFSSIRELLIDRYILESLGLFPKLLNNEFIARTMAQPLELLQAQNMYILRQIYKSFFNRLPEHVDELIKFRNHLFRYAYQYTNNLNSESSTDKSGFEIRKSFDNEAQFHNFLYSSPETQNLIKSDSFANYKLLKDDNYNVDSFNIFELNSEASTTKSNTSLKLDNKLVLKKHTRTSPNRFPESKDIFTNNKPEDQIFILNSEDSM